MDEARREEGGPRAAGRPGAAGGVGVAEGLAATLTQVDPAVPEAREGPGVGPRVGRFTILGRLGAGNMGVVYTAYDDILDRKIAIKVLRGGGEDGQLRLLREAQAMARISHPNVVAVHEVDTAGGQVYVAMEFIRGVTLQAWQREPGRDWAAIVDAYVQAGRGLAAAHEAGLVHRDFKPSNAMIGADGRVRVLDFGLVRARDGGEASGLDAASSHSRISLQITHEGDVLGTPAYMAPEQIRGLPVGPAADQFSLCVSLYEGLYGQLPFRGESLAALFRSISAGRVAEAPRGSRVPGWLRAALLRGLQPDPAARYPTMDALLRALGARPVGRRRLWIGVAAATVAAALAGFLVAKSQGPARCSGAEAELAAVWGPQARARVDAALGAAAPSLAAELRPRVRAALEVYATAWRASHRDACLSHARGEQSDLLLDRRMACLARRSAALGEAVAVLSEADPGVAVEALRVVHELPAVRRCNEVAALAAEVAPPDDPAVAATVSTVRRELTRAETLARAGRYAQAIALADRAVAAAEGGGYPPLEAEALVTRGRLALDTMPTPADLEALGRAMLLAVGSRMDELAAEAIALQVYARSRFADALATALDDVPLAEALARRLPEPDAVLGLLANNVGTVHLSRGARVAARTAFRAALERRQRALAPDDLELAYTLANLALVEDTPARRDQHLRRALGILAAGLGPAHPQTQDLRLTAARNTLDPAAAQALLEPGCAAQARLTPEDQVGRARCLADLGHHVAEAGDAGRAATLWQAASELLRGQEAPGSEGLRTAALAALGRGGADEALLARLRAGVAALAGATAWWARGERAELQLLLGLNLGETPAAMAALRAAVVDFVAVAEQGGDVFTQQQLASARVRLVELHARGLAPAEEISLDRAAAEAWYRAAGPAYLWRLDALMRAASETMN